MTINEILIAIGFSLLEAVILILLYNIKRDINTLINTLGYEYKK